jgi:hypothetical protein
VDLERKIPLIDRGIQDRAERYRCPVLNFALENAWLGMYYLRHNNTLNQMLKPSTIVIGCLAGIFAIVHHNGSAQSPTSSPAKPECQ